MNLNPTPDPDYQRAVGTLRAEIAASVKLAGLRGSDADLVAHHIVAKLHEFQLQWALRAIIDRPGGTT